MDPAMRRRAHAKAAALGISFAEYVRRLVAQDLGDTEVRGFAEADTKSKPVDRTSFAVMERLGLTRAASFDGDFATYPYGRRRDRAFEILR
jgi:uncharacterized protein